jgi:hypothetical protein
LTLIAVLLLVPASAWAQTSAKPVQLAWKFKEGEKFWVDTQTRIEQNQQSGGQSLTNIVILRTITSFVVKKITETNFVELEAKIESTRYNNVNQTPDGEKMSTLYGRLQGASFRIILSPERQVQKLDGYNEWLQKLSLIVPAAEVDRLRALIPETDIRNAISEGFAFLPEYPLSVGQQWRKKSELNLAPAGSLSCNLTYTYRGTADKGRDKVTIESKEPGKFALNASASTAGSQSTFALENRTGTIFFNNAIGKLDQAEHTYQTRGTVSFPAVGLPNSSQTIQVLNKVTVKQSLISRSPTR